ncbi:MAG: DUF3300 domain-containing protein [Gemmatimonas sp.]
MIRRPFALITALSLVTAAAAPPVMAQSGVPPAEYNGETLRFSANQLDNLVGPIALYPDALLAQVLVAATFPDQIEEAARFVRANGTTGIDDQSWDVSVKAVAHYASALNMMSEKSDWTTTLGRAYANQSTEVMQAVQRMRAMAAQHGNLVSTPQQQVVNEGDDYVIVPTQPRVIYVPVYDPIMIYTRPVFGMGFINRYWSFGVGFPIGGWLSYDLDWRGRRVYYNGWNDAYYEYGGGWRARSRPFIQITNIYVNPRYRNVYFNRDIYRRPINYGNVDRYGGVHRDTYFGGRRDGSREEREGRQAYRAHDDDRNQPGGGDRVIVDRGRNDDGRSGGGNTTPRTAQPRDDRPVATPEGYRNGGSDRGAAQRPRPEVEQRPTVVSAPEQRRNEPRSRDMNVAPESPRSAQPRNDAPRNDAPRIEPRRTERAQPAPRQEPRQEQPRQEQPRQVQPRQEQPRQAQPQSSGDRSAKPRVSRGSSGDDRGPRGRGQPNT